MQIHLFDDLASLVQFVSDDGGHLVQEVLPQPGLDQFHDQLHPGGGRHGAHQQVVHHAGAQGARPTAKLVRVDCNLYTFGLIKSSEIKMLSYRPAQLTG